MISIAIIGVVGSNKRKYKMGDSNEQFFNISLLASKTHRLIDSMTFRFFASQSFGQGGILLCQ